MEQSGTDVTTAAPRLTEAIRETQATMLVHSWGQVDATVR